MASNEASPTNEETGFTFTPGQTKLIMNIIQHTTEHKVSQPLTLHLSLSY